MAFLVEDGTGLTASTSYESVSDADTYHSEHGDPTGWSGATDAAKQAALMTATVYMDATYLWRGDIADSDQALGFPREDLVDRSGRSIASNIVPQKVQDCCSYLALQHILSALNATFDRGGEIVRQKVDMLEVQYGSGAIPGVARPYAKQIVSELITNSSGQVNLVRA